MVTPAHRFAAAPLAWRTAARALVPAVRDDSAWPARAGSLRALRPSQRSSLGGADIPTVFIVDDDASLRCSLAALLASVSLRPEPFESAEAFLRSFDDRRRGCLLLDIRMPGMDGLQLLQTLKSGAARLPVLVFTGHADVAMVMDVWRAGAFRLLQKPASPHQVLQCVHEAITLDRELRMHDSVRAAARSRVAQLTRRELDVLERLIDGVPNKCIAAELGITDRTVEKHRESIKQKTGTRSLAGLIMTVLQSIGTT